MVIPAEYFTGLPLHGVDFGLAEGNRPRQGRERIDRDIQRQQPPEIGWRRSVKIAVHHAGGKGRAFLCAPDDPVKFLPGIAVVEAVKIQDNQPAALKNHVADMVVPVLEALRPPLNEAAVVLDVRKENLPAVVFERAA